MKLKTNDTVPAEDIAAPGDAAPLSCLSAGAEITIRNNLCLGVFGDLMSFLFFAL